MRQPVLQLGRHAFDLEARAVVIGILNRTRDSFSDGGRHFTLDALLRGADGLVHDGADVLEIGGRAGGVGTEEVSVAEEVERVVTAVGAVRERFDAPLAVDTWRAPVAAEALRAGAVLANDMSGLVDPD